MKIFTLKWWFPKKRLSARVMRGPPTGYQMRDGTKMSGFEKMDDGTMNPRVKTHQGRGVNVVWKELPHLTPEQKAKQEITELARQKAVLRQQQDDEYGNVWAWLRTTVKMERPKKL